MVDIIFPDSVLDYVSLWGINKRQFLYTNLPELKHCEKYLKHINPINSLEIGAGIGRGSVFFFKYFGWENTNFYLLDGDSGKIKHIGVRENEKDGFYSSKKAAEGFCRANGMVNMKYLNAEDDDWESIAVMFDVVYSFLSIGFHWPISLYLNKIYKMLNKDALLIFGIRSKEIAYKRFIDDQIESINTNKYSILDLKLEPKGTRSSVLILKRV